MDGAKNILKVISGKKKCIKCGKTESVKEHNYAGLRFKDNYFAFPDRIKAPKIPGPKSLLFLCERCASTHYKIECRIHGLIEEQGYNGGKPPKCQICEEQLEQIIQNKLPPGFQFIVLLSSAVDSSGKPLSNPTLALSDDNILYIISHRAAYWDKIGNYSFKVVNQNNSLRFLIEHQKEDKWLRTCYVEITQSKVPKVEGTWTWPWDADEFCLVSIMHHKLKKEDFDIDKKFIAPCLIKLENNILLTYPRFSYVDLDKLIAWRLLEDTGSPQLEIVFENDKLPEFIRIKNLANLSGFKGIKNIAKELPQNRRVEDLSPIQDSGVFLLQLETAQEPTEFILSLDSKGENIIANSVPKKEKIKFTRGYSCGNFLLMVSGEEDICALCSTNPGAIKRAISVLQTPDNLLNLPSGLKGYYIDKNDSERIEIMSLFLEENGFRINGGALIKYSSVIRTEVQQDGDLHQLKIHYVGENGKKSILSMVAPEKYAYKTAELLELHRTRETFRSESLGNLYSLYYEHKKNYLLLGLFLDLIVLNRELNFEITMDDLSEKFARMDGIDLYEDKRLYELVLKKITLLSISLKNIRRKMEYLLNFYPYYHLKKEIGFLSEAFGSGVARKYLPYEQKRIVGNSRANIRKVQTKFLLAFSEIERSLYPIMNIIAKRDVNGKLSEICLKYFPHLAQASLFGIMLGTGAVTLGGLGIVAGMLVIRTMNDTLNYFRSDKESAALVKKAFETAYPWWNLVKQLWPVAVYEAEQALDEENRLCYIRDQRILNQVPSSLKGPLEKRLVSTLKKEIEIGTKMRFSEILENSKIRFDSLISEIESRINSNMHQQIQVFDYPRITS